MGSIVWVLILAMVISAALFVFLYLQPRMKKATIAAPADVLGEQRECLMTAGSIVMPELNALLKGLGYSTYEKLASDVNPDLLNNARKCFVAIDLNTTGLMGHLELTEVCAVRFCNGVVKNAYSSFIRPKEREDGSLPQNGGMDMGALANAPQHDEVISALVDFIGDDLLAAHNASFCGKLLIEACNRAGITQHFSFFDTLPMARTLYPALPNHKLKTVMAHISAEQEDELYPSNEAMAVAAILDQYLVGSYAEA